MPCPTRTSKPSVTFNSPLLRPVEAPDPVNPPVPLSKPPVPRPSKPRDPLLKVPDPSGPPPRLSPVASDLRAGGTEVGPLPGNDNAVSLRQRVIQTDRGPSPPHKYRGSPPPQLCSRMPHSGPRPSQLILRPFPGRKYPQSSPKPRCGTPRLRRRRPSFFSLNPDSGHDKRIRGAEEMGRDPKTGRLTERTDGRRGTYWDPAPPYPGVYLRSDLFRSDAFMDQLTGADSVTYRPPSNGKERPDSG